MKIIYTNFELTARDKFAIAAMQGWLTAGHLDPIIANVGGNADSLAERCYFVADALIRARE